MIAEIDDAPDDEKSGAERCLLGGSGEFLQRAGDGALRRQCAFGDDGCRIVGVASVLDERVQHARQLLGPGVRDDRAIQLRERGPVNACLLAAFILVTADERHRVAGATIGDGNARVGAGRDRVRDSGHDLIA